MDLKDKQLMKYCNLTQSHDEVIKRTTTEKLWIRHQGLIYSPWDYLWKFGVCHVVHQENTTLVDPVDLIEQAISILKQKINSGAAAGEITLLIERTEDFTKKVFDYYKNDIDSRLLKSIETGIWQL
jgi:hypothetical protein